MAIDPNIKKKADDIRNKVYGKEVRESLASGLEEMSSDVVENEGRQSVVEGRQSVVESRQDSVESQWQNVVDETTGKDVISAPEIIAARDGEASLKANIDKKHQEVTAQLAQKASAFTVNGLNDFLGLLFEPPLASDEWKTDTSNRVLRMTSDEFLDLFYNPLVGEYDDGYTITKSSLGKDESGLYDLWEYDFKPENYTETILLSSGMHAYELAASFGLAHYMNHLMVKPYMHAGFKYLKENVRIKVIPIINPWGWNQSPKTYGNVNGVNINRNFDSNGMWASYPGNTNEWDQKGAEPFSESETRILRDWVLLNGDAEFWIDCHTGITNAAGENWIYYLSEDPIVPTVLDTLGKLEDRIRYRYNVEPTTTATVDSQGSIRSFWTLEEAGMSTFTLEQSTYDVPWSSNINNEGADITEYEVTIAAYIFSLLIGEKGFVNSTNEKFDKILKPGKTTLIDSFNRANSESLGRADSGQEWIDARNFLKIANNKLKSGVPDGESLSYIETGQSDLDISVDLEWYFSAGLLFRLSNVGNYLMLAMNSTGISLRQGYSLQLASHTFNPTKGEVYNLRVVAENSWIQVYLNDLMIINIESEYNINATKVGFRFYNDPDSTYDNLEVKTITTFDRIKRIENQLSRVFQQI